MKKILYAILHTCIRPERYDGVVNSWGQNVDFLFYSDCDDEEKKIVKQSNDSSYASNELKHVNVIKYLEDNDYQYEWFFFCDDDTFVNTKNLEKNLDLFDKNKIHLFNIKEWVDGTIIQDVISNNDVHITGPCIVAGRELWPILEGLVHHSLNELFKNGLVDDDQTLLLMAYLQKPEFFELHRVNDQDWFVAFRSFNEAED